MARTQFHSVVTAVARTKFHTNRGIGRPDLTATEEALICRINDVQTDLDDKLTPDRLGRIDSLVDLPDVVNNVRAILDRIPQQPQPSSNPSPADIDRSQP